MNIKEWFNGLIGMNKKGAMPILSFPCVQMLGVSVNELVKNSDLQAQGMKLLADRYNTLASVSMMDLSVEAEAFGSSVRFDENEIPTVIDAIVKSYEDAENLAIPSSDSARCGVYINAIKKATGLIVDRPVFAGVIGPFSLAGRLMEVSEIMINCYEEPEMVELTLEKVTEFLINYVTEYKKAGANGVVMAEPLAGMLSPSLSKEFSEPYVKKIVDAVQDDEFAVIYHNCGDNIALMADSIMSTGAMVYHFGNAVKMDIMLDKFPATTVLMGNVDPARQIRNGSPQSVIDATEQLLKDCSKYPNFVISSGCDIPHDSPFANIDAFFDVVEKFYN